MEQRDLGEMSEMQYQHMTNKLRMLTEQEQIREAKERERQRHQQPQQQPSFSSKGGADKVLCFACGMDNEGQPKCNAVHNLSEIFN